VPEIVAIILHPGGGHRVPQTVDRVSELGVSGLQLRWRVVELWKLSAEDLLAANDVGLIPWVPLTQFTEPPEQVLEICRQRIDKQAVPTERENLLAVSQVLAKLRYNDPGLLNILGGRKVMIESPLIEELVQERLAEQRQGDIGTILKDRFGSVPADLAHQLKTITDQERLAALFAWALRCPDLEAFRVRMAQG
jgi:hypothetical protein